MQVSAPTQYKNGQRLLVIHSSRLVDATVECLSIRFGQPAIACGLPTARFLTSI